MQRHYLEFKDDAHITRCYLHGQQSIQGRPVQFKLLETLRSILVPFPPRRGSNFDAALAAEEAPSWTARLLPSRRWRALSNTTRLLVLRVALRVAFLALLVGLIRAFPSAAMAAGSAVLSWIHTYPTPFAELIFFAASSLFCAVSPTGYLPALAAGIAFPPSSSIPITYTSVLLGAALNVALVRGLFLRRKAGPPRLVSRYKARGASLLSGALREAIAMHPVAMVALLRLPYLGNGALNYIFSLHRDLPLTPMMAGNAVGMALGSVLFPLAGSQVRSLGSMIAVGPGEGAARDAALGLFFGILVVVALSMGAATIVVRRVLRRIVAERAALRRSAGPAEPPKPLSGADLEYLADAYRR